MKSSGPSYTPFRTPKVAIRIIVCAVVLSIGVLGMISLSGMKAPPHEERQRERALRVEVLPVVIEDVPVIITGYGEARALNVVSIATEVAGKIVEIHPRLAPGEIIPAGDILFKIDQKDYKAAYEEEKAVVRKLEQSILRLEKQRDLELKRIVTYERNLELAKAEFERLRKLYQEDKVGTRSGVDAAEREANSAYDQAYQLARAVDIYPIQIKEAQSDLAAAMAKMGTAKIRMERCEVRAPFTGRVKEASVEVGQYVSPGQSAVVLSNDAVLEIHVALDSRDASQWLRFSSETPTSKAAWFSNLEPVTCKIHWTEDREERVWEGRLHQVVKFDQQTRTVTIGVRVEAEKALSTDPRRLPLVEGMFCSVKIPGRTMQNVARIPRSAVSMDNTVYVSVDNRLKTVPVQVKRIEGDQAFITGSLQPGDMVITTRLVNPLENALVEIIGKPDKGRKS